MKNIIEHDRELKQLNAIFVLPMLVIVMLLTLLLVQDIMFIGLYILAIIASLIMFFRVSFFINSPNEARVIEFFGYYIGTYFRPGIFMTIPFAHRYVVSMKFENINTEKIKVNDANGSPIEISVVIIWKVDNPAKAYYNVNNYYEFVAIQSESVIRELASSYPYDSEGDVEESLRKNSVQIANELQSLLQNRLSIAGVNVIESRISHLAYSSEIAQAMLKRQQAHAVTSARKHIVQNAIEIIEEIIIHFEKNKKITLDDQQRVQLINNLLITLISDKDPLPTFGLD
ncbi:spfh domain/band 7 family protein [Wolbachia pipientis]|uniref:Spfh domain/band 7 family protein n=1 Tax=Wolbachia pipientis TaxID=955 RepID=A0A1E7QKF9_WOLPI|nr:SPFH domain-containing protein [Wolbachia pipientis]OEY86704.1 spfh domain/band 7 family protein [Wolbachia pipientis]